MGASQLPGFQNNSMGFFFTKICFQLSNIFDNFSILFEEVSFKTHPPHLYKSDPWHSQNGKQELAMALGVCVNQVWP